MENRYKIILSGNQIYKEAELPADMERVTVGTGIDCTVRLRRDLFFESIQIEFVKESGGWRATCSDNIYFTEGDIRKYMTRKVIHGDTLEVRYQESEGLVFRIDFQIDFDSGSHRCERMINLDRYQTISIGNNSAYEIALSGVYAKREFVRLTRGQGGWTLEVMNSEYGVYHNGNRKFLAEGKNYVLIGPGRWGSSDHYLGVPVKWPHISAARVIVEVALKNYNIDPSQGTHFFQNLTSFGVGYFTVDTNTGEGGFVNQEILDAMPAVEETQYVRHVRFEHPMRILMDGKKQEGAVLIPKE